MFNKVIEMSMLYDFYGQLLTDKQRDVMQLHYEDDYSLSEIGEILAISRQAVHDAIKKAEKSLKDYEEKLKLLQKFNETIIRYNRIQELADQAIQGLEKENIKDMGIKNILIEIKNELKEDS
ncbi:MAG: putative DNA-binding protein [Peptostreptococcales bacterium]